VILDYQMPEMNGELVAAEMRKTNPRVPILMLSGCESLPENALQLVDEFIAKEDPVESLRLAVQPTVKPVAKAKAVKPVTPIRNQDGGPRFGDSESFPGASA